MIGKLKTIPQLHEFVVWDGKNEEDIINLLCKRPDSINTIFLFDRTGGVYLYYEDTKGTYTVKITLGNYILSLKENIAVADKEDFDKYFEII